MSRANRDSARLGCYIHCLARRYLVRDTRRTTEALRPSVPVSGNFPPASVMMDSTTTSDARHRPSRGLARAAPVALVATIIPIVGQVLMVGAGPFIAVTLRGSGTAGWVAFTIGFTLLAALLVAPTYTTSIVAGWAFGFA